MQNDVQAIDHQPINPSTHLSPLSSLRSPLHTSSRLPSTPLPASPPKKFNPHPSDHPCPVPSPGPAPHKVPRLDLRSFRAFRFVLCRPSTLYLPTYLPRYLQHGAYPSPLDLALDLTPARALAPNPQGRRRRDTRVTYLPERLNLKSEI